MGNCQAAEVATVVIHHPGGRAERFYWSLTATDVMASNPGHYVAAVITSAPRGGLNTGSRDGAAAPVKHLKLLRPDDTLQVGHVYRLVSFEEVLKEFGAKKQVRLSRLLAGERRERRRGGGRGGGGGDTDPVGVRRRQREEEAAEDGTGDIVGGGGQPSDVGVLKHGQWRPTLQSIAELGS